MADLTDLPNTLAILPLTNKVLLPGAFTRIRCTSPSSVKLVENELWQREFNGYIGILPVRDPQSADTSSAASSDLVNGNLNIGHSWDIQKQVLQQSHDCQLYRRGVVARALRVLQAKEKPSGRIMYTVEFEGLCRFNVQEIVQETDAKSFYSTARVSYLDMTKSEVDQAEKDPEVQVLSRQLKVIAGELKAVLEQISHFDEKQLK